jgi:hypothetical protein
MTECSTSWRDWGGLTFSKGTAMGYDERLDHLERRLRSVRRWNLVLAAALMTVAGLAAQAPFAQLVCNSLQVRNPENQPTTTLHSNGDIDVTGRVSVHKDVEVKGKLINTELGTKLDDLTTKLSAATKRLDTVEGSQLQVESDTIIGDATKPGWTLNLSKGNRSWTTTVPFSRKFRESPKIVFGLTHFDVGPAIGNHRLDVSASATNETITVTIKTWDDSGVAGAIISWMAVGLPSP